MGRKKNKYCLQHLSMMVTVEQKLEVKKIVKKSYEQDKNWTFFLCFSFVFLLFLN